MCAFAALWCFAAREVASRRDRTLCCEAEADAVKRSVAEIRPKGRATSSAQTMLAIETAAHAAWMSRRKARAARGRARQAHARARRHESAFASTRLIDTRGKALSESDRKRSLLDNERRQVLLDE